MPRGRAKPSAIDVYVGKKVRQRRVLLGITQEKLGKALDLTFQQVQKYERGSNRIGAGRLHELAAALHVPVSFFFEGLPKASTEGKNGEQLNEAIPPDLMKPDILNQKGTLELLNAFYRIRDPVLRRRVFKIVKALGSEQQKDAPL